MILTKAYKLKEVAKLLGDYPSTSVTPDIISFENSDVWNKCFSDFLYDLYYDVIDPLKLKNIMLQIKGVEYDDLTADFSMNSFSMDLFNKVFSRYAEWVAMEIPFELWDSISDERIHKGLYKFVSRFINIYNNTYDKYQALYTAYQTLSSTLITSKKSTAKVETENSASGVNRFNDTPQNDGTFDEDTHTTNINESETSGEGETNSTYNNNDLYDVEKIQMLHNKYLDILLAWSNEFERMFSPLSYDEELEELLNE